MLYRMYCQEALSFSYGGCDFLSLLFGLLPEMVEVDQMFEPITGVSEYSFGRIYAFGISDISMLQFTMILCLYKSILC